MKFLIIGTIITFIGIALLSIDSILGSIVAIIGAGIASKGRRDIDKTS